MNKQGPIRQLSEMIEKSQAWRFGDTIEAEGVAATPESGIPGELEKIEKMIADRASRSSVCSLINRLEHSGLLGHGRANNLADFLESDRGNAIPVLRAIAGDLEKHAGAACPEKTPDDIP